MTTRPARRRGLRPATALLTLALIGATPALLPTSGPAAAAPASSFAPASTAPAATAPAAGPSTIRTDQGRVRGKVHRKYRSFAGVRYAAPAQRWVRATAPRSFAGVRSAARPGSDCVQEAVFWRPASAASTDEDCLFLNVYAPRRRVTKKPVLVFFHGGGGINGSATDVHPTRMAASGRNVVVTVNYRLGVLGGLDLPGLDAESPDGLSGGNYANTDKIQALRWIKQNIRAFGGDPKRVSVNGQSAGAGGVCFLLASPTAAGLFSAAGIESAGTCGAATSRESAQQSGQEFATAAGCPDPAVALACLRGKSTADLLDVQAARGTGAPAVFGGGDLPVAPLDAFSSGAFNQVPVIFGNTRNESRAFVYEENDLVRQPVTPASFEASVRADYGADADAVLAAYPLGAYRSPGVALAQVGTDDRVCGGLSSLEQLARWTPTWAYEFRDETAPLRPYMSVPPSYRIGSGHTSEVPYLWQSDIATPLSARQLRLSRLMTAYWTSLVRTGKADAGPLPHGVVTGPTRVASGCCCSPEAAPRRPTGPASPPSTTAPPGRASPSRAAPAAARRRGRAAPGRSAHDVNASTTRSAIRSAPAWSSAVIVTAASSRKTTSCP